MVETFESKQRLDTGGDCVLFDSKGVALAATVPPDIGPATLLVAPVTDALNTTTSAGLVDQSLDRDDIWAVKGYALNRVVVDRLESSTMTPRQLVEAVSKLRFGWQGKAMSEM